MLRYFQTRSGVKRFGPAEFVSLDEFLERDFAPVATLVAETPRRVVALGDLHGDISVLWAELCASECINDEGHWIGGETSVVQVGDFLDRGGRVDSRGRSVSLRSKNPREELDIMQYVYALDREAQQAGGSVIMLSGNHEYMNFAGDFSCTTEVTNEGWGGIEGRRQSFTPGSQLASYFEARHPAILKLGQLVFVHGGLGAPCADSDADGFDKYALQVNGAWARFLSGRIQELPDCVEEVLFSRRVSDHFQGSEEECESVSQELFRRVGLGPEAVLCVGHTPQVRGYQPTAGVNGVCGKSMWRLDVAASAAFGKSSRAENLEIITVLGQPPKFRIIRVRDQ